MSRAKAVAAIERYFDEGRCLLARSLSDLKERNVWIVGADERAERTLYESDLMRYHQETEQHFSRYARLSASSLRHLVHNPTGQVV